MLVMEIDRIPPELLNGKSLHCQPVEDGPILEASIFSSEGLLPTAKFVIVCPARLPGSKCELRIKSKSDNAACLYYKGDSMGDYQIIGLDMDKKSDTGYQATDI